MALAQIEMHLDDRLPKINFQKVSLREFLDVLSQFSTLPIALDQEALARAGKGPQTLITVQLADATVAQVLEAGLTRHGLIAIVRGGKLVVTVADGK